MGRCAVVCPPKEGVKAIFHLGTLPTRPLAWRRCEKCPKGAKYNNQGQRPWKEMPPKNESPFRGEINRIEKRAS